MQQVVGGWGARINRYTLIFTNGISKNLQKVSPFPFHHHEGQCEETIQPAPSSRSQFTKFSHPTSHPWRALVCACPRLALPHSSFASLLLSGALVWSRVWSPSAGSVSRFRVLWCGGVVNRCFALDRSVSHGLILVWSDVCVCRGQLVGVRLVWVGSICPMPSQILIGGILVWDLPLSRVRVAFDIGGMENLV